MYTIMVSIFLTVFSCALFADTHQFTYLLDNYPKSDPSCHQTAKQLGEKFAQAAQANVVSSRCIEQTTDTADIEIVYSAEDKVAMASTSYFYSGIYPTGRYAKKETCLQQRNYQTELFEKATGLRHFVSYCIQTSEFEKLPWSLQIDGLGTSIRQARLGGFAYFTVPANLNSKSFVASLTARISSHDGILADVVSTPSIGYGTLSVHYYSKNRLEFNFDKIAYSRSLEQCELQKAAAEEAMTGLMNPPVSIYCGYAYLGASYELNLFFVDTADAFPFKMRKSVENFPSFATCESGRKALIEFYKKDLNQNILGGICSLTEKTVSVILLEKR